VLAVLFAYITNKLFVFESKSFASSVLKKEMLSFFWCRLLTGIIDVAIMYVTVDLFLRDSTSWKVISNILVILLNYIASKRIIFPTGK
jgi:putative flippase GtrA